MIIKKKFKDIEIDEETLDKTAILYKKIEFKKRIMSLVLLVFNVIMTLMFM